MEQIILRSWAGYSTGERDLTARMGEIAGERHLTAGMGETANAG